MEPSFRPRTVSSNAPILERIARAVQSIRYGTVQIIIQDSKIVRLEKTEKIQLPQEEADQTAGGPYETRS